MTTSPRQQAPLTLQRADGKRLATLMWIALWGIAVGLTLSTVQKYANQQGGDLHNYFYPAARMLVTGEWQLLDPTERGTFNTSYLPVTFLLFVPFSTLPWLVAAAAWSVFSVICLLLTVVIGGQLIGTQLRTMIDAATLPTAAVLTIALLVAKIVADLNLGQIDILLGLLLVLAIKWLPNRPLQAGAVLALVAAFKMVGLIFLPWLLLRRAWRAAAALVVTYVVLWLAMVPWLGWRVASEFFVLLVQGPDPALQHTVASEGGFAATSLSAAAGLRRLLESMDVDLGTAVPLMMLGGMGLFAMYVYRRYGKPLFNRRINADRSLDLVEFACIPAAAIVLHSYSHNRHWCFAILLFLILAQLLIVPGPRRSRAVLLGVALALMLQQLHVADALGFGEAWARFGGTGWLMLLVLLSVLWAVLRDTPTNRLQMPDHASAAKAAVACPATGD
jgi:hypothetical protein